MKKKFLLYIAVILAAVIFVCTLDIKTPEEYYTSHIADISKAEMTVTVTVSCETVLNNYDSLSESVKNADIIPKDGVIIPKGEFALHDGDTAFDVLRRILAYYQIPLDYSGDPDKGLQSVYVKGIANLYERDCGELSGWMFCVNGKFPQVSSSDYTLNDGDVLEWLYSCDLGKDVGDNYTISNCAVVHNKTENSQHER